VLIGGDNHPINNVVNQQFAIYNQQSTMSSISNSQSAISNQECRQSAIRNLQSAMHGSISEAASP
jgi:uncharacterized protein YcfL